MEFIKFVFKYIRYSVALPFMLAGTEFFVFGVAICYGGKDAARAYRKI